MFRWLLFGCLCLFAFVLVMVVFCVFVLVCGILSLVDLLAGWWVCFWVWLGWLVTRYLLTCCVALVICGFSV